MNFREYVEKNVRAAQTLNEVARDDRIILGTEEGDKISAMFKDAVIQHRFTTHISPEGIEKYAKDSEEYKTHLDAMEYLFGPLSHPRDGKMASEIYAVSFGNNRYNALVFPKKDKLLELVGTRDIIDNRTGNEGITLTTCYYVTNPDILKAYALKFDGTEIGSKLVELLRTKNIYYEKPDGISSEKYYFDTWEMAGKAKKGMRSNAKAGLIKQVVDDIKNMYRNLPKAEQIKKLKELLVPVGSGNVVMLKRNMLSDKIRQNLDRIKYTDNSHAIQSENEIIEKIRNYIIQLEDELGSLSNKTIPETPAKPIRNPLSKKALPKSKPKVNINALMRAAKNSLK